MNYLSRRLIIAALMLSLGIGFFNLAKLSNPPRQNTIHAVNGHDHPQTWRRELAVMQDALRKLATSQALLQRQIAGLSNTRKKVSRLSPAEVAPAEVAPAEVNPAEADMHGKTTGDGRPASGKSAPEAAPHATETSQEDGFSNAPVNAGLTQETEASMQRSLLDLDVRDTKIESVECRGSNCRVSFIHGDGMTGDEFLSRIMMTPPFSEQFSVKTVLTSDGREQSVFFLR